jgi:hypothetical protein
MIRAPLKKRSVVPMTDVGDAIGVVKGAARRVEKRHGKNK